MMQDGKSILERLRAAAKPVEAVTHVPSAELPAVIERLQKIQESSSYVSEIKRVCGLPLIPGVPQEQLDLFNKQNVIAEQYQKGFRFFDVQAKAVLSYDKFGGLFCFIGCGHGKTAITLMVAYRAFKKGIQRSVLLIPPDVYYQLVKVDIPRVRSWTQLAVPFIKLGRVNAFQRELAASRGKKGCYILPYSMLSTKNGTQVLTSIAPQLIIADEAHNLKNKSSAKTRRLMEYITNNNPEFVALSGTMTSKSIADYHHLIKAALGPNSPLPATWQEAQDWGIVIDASSSPSEEQMRPLAPIVQWGREKYPTENFTIDVAGYRKAYQKRLETAPGVVASGDKEIGTSLIIRNFPVKTYKKIKNPDGTSVEKIDAKGGDNLKAYLDLVESGKTPNGDEIDHAIHKFKWLYELSSGFYYELIWPEAKTVAEDRTKIVREFGTAKEFTIENAEKALEAAKDHHEALQEYAKELRTYFKEPVSGIDTPMLVGAEFMRNGPRILGHKMYNLWMIARSKNVDPFEALGPRGQDRERDNGFKLVERESKPVSVCGYKIDAAVEWALECLKKPAPEGESRGGIIWCHHKHIGRWVYVAIRKAFVAAGAVPEKLDDYVIFCPRGDEANRRIADPTHRNKIIVASLAHRTGKNLQFMQRQMFLQWPRSSEWAEQAIARIHRNGQIADEVYVDTMHTTDFDYIVLSACLNDALYTHQTTGSRQKIITATYNPMPKIFPRNVLIEKGMQPKQALGDITDLFKEGE